MFPASTLMKLLAVLESKRDVNHFVAGKVHLWPLARFCLASKKQDNDQAIMERPAALRQVDATIEAEYQGLLAHDGCAADRSITDFDGVRIGEARLGANGILVFSRAEDHYLRSPKGYYAPVIDPWCELAAARWPCAKVELATSRFAESQPRHVNTVLFQPPPSAFAPAQIAELQKLIECARALATDVAEWLQREIGYSYPEFLSDLERYVADTWLEKTRLGELLDAVNPGLVLTSCYYFRPTLSMTWAAREKNIAVVDVQHGGNGPYHMGYSHWRNPPPGGYMALPDCFFTWDSFSANNIARWLPAASAHRVAVTGRFDIETTRRAYMGETQQSPLGLAALGSSKVVLVTLQTLPSTGLSAKLIEVMKKAPPDWTWLVRTHPMAVAWKLKDMTPDEIEVKLRDSGITRAECRLSTSLPLAAILPIVNHHLTAFSGTVQECAAFGIRTTFMHSAAKFAFQQYIDAGIADFASDTGSAIASIERPWAPTSGSAAFQPPTDVERPYRALAQFLG
jgi:hypothetical protein